MCKLSIFTGALILVSSIYTGCSGTEESSGYSGQASFKTEAEARAASPVGEVCVLQEPRIECVPDNRGRGNSNCTNQEIPGVYAPAFLVGDVDYDGVAGTRDDAAKATKGIYVKQIEKELCPATADIGTFPRGWGGDGYLTSEDIVLWRSVKQTGSFPLAGQLICASDCSIVNHMSPSNK